ncbi:MAG TPA: GntR family transcriptional regulator [Acidimicrobiia bacterium]|nr:GntR family transcriptional regulator [Acidimicrobiia bacterium]
MLHISARIGGTVRARAAEELRNRILTGALAPGTRLDLDALTTEFGASRTPIREALLELSYEGLVEVAPRSGITVIGLTPRDVLDNFAILGTLAGKAAEWAAARISGDELDHIRALADDVTAASGATAGVARDSLVSANWRFHRAVHRASGSPRILTLIRQTVGVVPTNFFDVFPDRGEHSASDHDDLVAALARRDGAAARSAAEGHVTDAGVALARFLEQGSKRRRRAR